MRFSRKIAIALEKTIPCKRVGMAVIGLEVPHVHVHLIPLEAMQDIQFMHKVTLKPAEFEVIAKEIAANM
jgi:histidine triad (HIT) family protein